MNKIYLISYDLNKIGKNYSDLYTTIKNHYTWWHYLDSTWLIYTSESTNQIWNRFSSIIDNNDSILIIEVKDNYQGWLPKEAWIWIKKYMPISIH